MFFFHHLPFLCSHALLFSSPARLWLRYSPGFNLPNRNPEPPAGGFGKPVGKSRLPLKTEQIQISN
jgi:hypothetical protein